MCCFSVSAVFLIFPECHMNWFRWLFFHSFSPCAFHNLVFPAFSCSCWKENKNNSNFSCSYKHWRWKGMRTEHGKQVVHTVEQALYQLLQFSCFSVIRSAKLSRLSIKGTIFWKSNKKVCFKTSPSALDKSKSRWHVSLLRHNFLKRVGWASPVTFHWRRVYSACSEYINDYIISNKLDC